MPKAERARVIAYLRAERGRGIKAPELAERTGLSKATVNKLAPLGRKRRSKFVKLGMPKVHSEFVVEGAHGLTVRCSDASKAAAVLVAAAKQG